jgi:hypothetical protein
MKVRLEKVVAARLPLDVYNRLMVDIGEDTPSVRLRKAVDAYLLVTEGAADDGTRRSRGDSKSVRR